MSRDVRADTVRLLSPVLTALAPPLPQITMCGLAAHSQYSEYVRFVFACSEVPALPDGVGPREGCLTLNLEPWAPETADEALVRCVQQSGEIVRPRPPPPPPLPFAARVVLSPC